MAKRNNYTPDRQINPDEEERFKTCLPCNGKGKIIVWCEDEGEQTPEYQTCEHCKGEGVIETEGWEHEC